MHIYFTYLDFFIVFCRDLGLAVHQFITWPWLLQCPTFGPSSCLRVRRSCRSIRQFQQTFIRLPQLVPLWSTPSLFFYASSLSWFTSRIFQVITVLPRQAQGNGLGSASPNPTWNWDSGGMWILGFSIHSPIPTCRLLFVMWTFKNLEMQVTDLSLKKYYWLEFLRAVRYIPETCNFI